MTTPTLEARLEVLEVPHKVNPRREVYITYEKGEALPLTASRAANFWHQLKQIPALTPTGYCFRESSEGVRASYEASFLSVEVREDPDGKLTVAVSETGHTSLVEQVVSNFRSGAKERYVLDERRVRRLTLQAATAYNQA